MSTGSNGQVKKQGILRVDTGRSRRSSPVTVVEPTSPQPSVDRLSVSFANDEKKVETPSLIRTSITEDAEDGVEEDYSASANVILDRRQDSWKRRSSKRRGSSALSQQPPQPGARRRSSVFTSSSETGVSAEDAAHQNLRIHKEVVAQLKYQPWPIRRKLRLVQQAKSYIKLHEGQIQERLAQKKSTRDILAHSKIVFLNYWNYFMRESGNLLNSLSPWESRIKEIESHFGSAVASYFTFHRWLFSVNLKISVALLVFVILPEIIFANRSPEFAGDRKCMLKEEAMKSKKFLTLWNFEGILKHSPIFYGFYNSRSTLRNSFENRLPFFYFITGLGLYAYSFVAILRKMAVNSRLSKLTEKDEYYIFTWKIFTSWDYMIGNPETSHNRISSIILGFKEALLEEAEKTRDEKRNWKLLSIRILTHLSVLCLLASSVYLVIVVVSRSQIAEAGKMNKKLTGWWRQNEVTIVFSLIGMVYPVLFDLIGLLEKYHPRKGLRLQLARIMVLNLLNLYSFIIATFTSIHTLSRQSCQNMPNATAIEGYKRLHNCGDSRNVSSGGLRPGLVAAALLMSVPTDPSPALRQLYDPSQDNAPVFPLDITHNTLLNNSGFPDVEVNKFKFHVHNSEYDPPVMPNRMPLTNSNSFLPMATSSTISPLELPNGFNYSFIPEEITFSNNTENTPTEELFGVFLNNTENTPTEESNLDVTYEYDVRSSSFPGISSYTEDNITENQTLHQTFEIYEASNSTDVESVSSTVVETENASTADPHPSSSDNGEGTVPTKFFGISDTIPNFQTDEVIGTPTGRYDYYTSSTAISSTDGTLWGLDLNLKGSGQWQCEERANRNTPNEDYSPLVRFLDLEERRKIHSQCWETMFGQELVKLTVMDLALTLVSILSVDFFRAIFVRVMNRCWFWDLEKKFPQYGDFKIAENILHLVNNQGMVWMGMFFSPGLPIINVLKLVILMYMRSWAVLTCNVPHEVVFRASKSNNFYFGLLLTMLFLCVLPVGYALVWIDTSWHCGPFSKYNRIYYLFTHSLPQYLQNILNYVASPGIIIPLLVLLILIIFYLISLTNLLREANDDLKIQLRHERTEERRKVFQMANKKRKGIDTSESPFNKWCRAMNNSISRKTSIDITASFTTQEKLLPKLDNIAADMSNGTRDNQSDIKDKGSPKNSTKADHPDNGRERNDSLIDTFRDREDSIISGWSVDNLPEIKISQSEASDGLSGKSPDTHSQSKSSSKETIIDMESTAGRPHDVLQDDVFVEADKKNVKPQRGETRAGNAGDEETENEESIGYADSDESISKSLAELNDIGSSRSPETDQSNASRRNLAKILVESLIKD